MGFGPLKIVMRLTDKQLAAIVDEAQFSNPEAADYILKTLIARRDKVGRTWFKKFPPLDAFEIRVNDSEADLHFEDLAVSAKFVEPATRTYQLELKKWKSEQLLVPVMKATKPRFHLPLADLRDHKRVIATLSTNQASTRRTAGFVDVVVDLGAKPTIVGLRRY